METTRHPRRPSRGRDAALLGTLQHTVMQDLTGHKRTEISQTLPPGESVWPTCIMVGPLDDRRAGDDISEVGRGCIVALGCAPRGRSQLPGHCCGMLHMRSVALHLAFVILSNTGWQGTALDLDTATTRGGLACIYPGSSVAACSERRAAMASHISRSIYRPPTPTGQSVMLRLGLGSGSGLAKRPRSSTLAKLDRCAP